MDEVRDAVYALAEGTKKYILQIGDNTKYGAVALKAEDFLSLVYEEDYQDVLIDNLPGEKYAEIQEREDTRYLVFDTDNIPRQVLIQESEMFEALHKRSQGFALAHRRGISKVMKQDGGMVDRVFERFQDRIPRRLLPVLEEGLVLRALERKQNLHHHEVYQWRGEIADCYGEKGNDPQEAQHLISLCSTGYFDKNNIFDNMYSNCVEQGCYSNEDYRDLLSKYISNNPFAVFVQAQGTPVEEVCGETRNKLNLINEWEASPGFVEVCGKGKHTHDIVEEVHENIKPEFDGNTSIRQNPEIDQLIIRFEPAVI